MNHRSLVRLSSALIAAAVIGCNDGPTEPGPFLEITPIFTGVAEGDSVQLEATFNGEPVEVTWESSDEEVATVSSTGWVRAHVPGRAAATATMVSNPNLIRSASITVIPIPALTSGTAVTGLSGATGSQAFYKIEVPAGATQLRVAVSGGSGDVDLYVRFGARPTHSAFDCRPFLGGNNETCTINNPTAGMWFILLDVYAEYAGASLTATITP